jgi:hypothetical protein
MCTILHVESSAPLADYSCNMQIYMHTRSHAKTELACTLGSNNKTQLDDQGHAKTELACTLGSSRGSPAPSPSTWRRPWWPATLLPTTSSSRLRTNSLGIRRFAHPTSTPSFVTSARLLQRFKNIADALDDHGELSIINLLSSQPYCFH